MLFIKHVRKYLLVLNVLIKIVLSKLYGAQIDTGEFSVSPEAMGQRALKNVLLGILTSNEWDGVCFKG